MLEFKEAYLRIINNTECIQLFTEDDWKGVVCKNPLTKKKEKFKYKFRDKDGHIFISTYDNVSNGHTYRCKYCARQSQIKKKKNK